MGANPELLVVVLLALAGLSTGFWSGPILDDDGSEPLTVRDVSDGRLVHYDFEGENATRIPNRANSRHEGVLRGDAENVSSVPRDGGSAVRFDGHPGHFEVANSSDLPAEYPVTVAFRLKLDEEQKANLLGAWGGYYFWVGESWRGNPRTAFVVMNGDEKLAQPSSEIPAGEWIHVVGTYDGNRTAKLFVDGELADTRTVDEPPTVQEHNLSINMGGWTDEFGGSVDDVSVWNRSLPADEVNALARGDERVIDASAPLRFGLTLLLLLVIAGVTVRD